jgi:integrase
MLRHTHASHLIWAGVPIPVFSARLGHANIQITVDLYGHLQEGVQDREAVEALKARRQRLLAPTLDRAGESARG